MNVLGTSAVKFLEDKIKRYVEFSGTRRQVSIYTYLLELVKRDAGCPIESNNAYYEKYICKGCGSVVDSVDTFCRHCGMRIYKWLCYLKLPY